MIRFIWTSRSAGCTALLDSQAAERALSGVDGVHLANVLLASEEAVVKLSVPVSEDALIASVEGAGYGVAQGKSREDVLVRDRRRLFEARRRARLAWILAIPVIGWMIPEMAFGLMWPSPLVFHLGMVALATPVLFLAGVRAALSPAPTMDTLIAPGTIAWFVRGLAAVGVELTGGSLVLNYA
ncbi:MAG: cation transporter [Candidatus Bipolaricaulia bacterium]